MSNFSTERDIAKFFALSSVNVRLDACQMILLKVSKMVYSDEKREFLNTFLKYLKEWQTLNQKSSAMAGSEKSRALQGDSAVLDATIANKIISQITMGSARSNSPNKRMTAPEPAPQKKSFNSFKSMKRDKQKQIATEMVLESQAQGGSLLDGMQESEQIKRDVEEMCEGENKN